LLLQSLPLHDFITYWSAGRLFLAHSNPYSSTALLAVERSQGWPYPEPFVMLCPPWTLPIVAMIASVPMHVARISWLGSTLILNCFSAMGLWLYFGGARREAWIALVAIATFFPMGGAEYMGQITPLIVASITAFLLLLRSRHDFLAGLALLGFGPKPHLLYLVWLALALWIIRERRWKILAGALASYAATSTAAILYNGQAIDYFHNTYGAAIETACGVGGLLRHTFGMQHTWLQWLPSVVGLAWFAAYWRRHRHTWNWQSHLPLLLAVSVASSPYCWHHDFILITPAIISLAVRQAWRSVPVIICYLLLQTLIGIGPLKALADTMSSLWILFFWLADSEISLAKNHHNSARTVYGSV
jgi:Glycosyltransferase family 87